MTSKGKSAFLGKWKVFEQSHSVLKFKSKTTRHVETFSCWFRYLIYLYIYFLKIYIFVNICFILNNFRVNFQELVIPLDYMYFYYYFYSCLLCCVSYIIMAFINFFLNYPKILQLIEFAMSPHENLYLLRNWLFVLPIPKRHKKRKKKR